MKKFLIMAVMAIAMVNCNREWDTPSVKFLEESYTVPSNGGELIIPVNSTGVDDVHISYKGDSDGWEADPETGDRTPAGWIKLVKIIEQYDTRALAQWTSGICVDIEPNNSGKERIGYVTVTSFATNAKVVIKQGF